MTDHSLNKLTAKAIAKYVKDGKGGSRLSDGGGLYAIKRSTGRRVPWAWIGVLAGKRVERGLGSIRDVTLAEAREQAARYRKGEVPQGSGSGVVVRSFAVAAAEYRAAFEGTWKGHGTGAQFDQVVRTYCVGIADRVVGELVVADVLQVMDACEGKPSVQALALSVIRRVIDREMMLGNRSVELSNPATRERVRLIRPIVHRTEHHASMPYADVPAFVQRLRGLGTQPARALELLILTGLRSNEALGLRWSEVDLVGCLLDNRG